MKKLNFKTLEDLNGGACYDLPQTPHQECFNPCLFGAIFSGNPAAVAAFVTSGGACIA